METKVLGNSDLRITPIGFGAWAIGGDWEFGWGAQDDAQSIAAIHRALELGVNWIDTAAVSGLPKTDWRTRNDQFKEPKLSKNLQLVERLRAVGTRHGRAPGEVAIAWTLRHPAVTGAIVGARDPKQVDGVIGAMDFRLTTAEIAELEGQ